MNYLTEHGLLEYTDLAAKTDEARTQCNGLLDKIKAAEKRIVEIACRYYFHSFDL